MSGPTGEELGFWDRLTGERWHVVADAWLRVHVRPAVAGVEALSVAVVGGDWERMSAERLRGICREPSRGERTDVYVYEIESATWRPIEAYTSARLARTAVAGQPRATAEQARAALVALGTRARIDLAEDASKLLWAHHRMRERAEIALGSALPALEAIDGARPALEAMRNTIFEMVRASGPAK